MRIASGSQDRTLKIWDTKSGNKRINKNNGKDYQLKPLSTVEEFLLFNLMITKSSVLEKETDPLKVYFSILSHFIVWDIRDGSQNAMLSMNGHTQNVYKLIFDNNHVISGGFDTVKGNCKTYNNDKTVWDLRTGNLVRDLNDHSTHASCFSLVNANQVVTGCLDGQMKLWDINTGANSTLNGRANEFTNWLYCRT